MCSQCHKPVCALYAYRPFWKKLCYECFKAAYGDEGWEE